MSVLPAGAGNTDVHTDFDVAGETTPSHPPTAHLVTDAHGNSRWTVTIPHNYSFPLPGRNYQDLCTQGTLLRDRIVDGKRSLQTKAFWRKSNYYTSDPTFLDIQDAENAGVLPTAETKESSNVCEKSLTFVLDHEDASFGKSLLLLWLSYGLAKKEERAFFIDDSRWAWGKYGTYFLPPPSARCSRPAAHRIVPCPHNAKHLVISSATISWSFSPEFDTEFTLARKHGFTRQSRIYELLRTGYENLFKLTGEDSLYAAARIAKFKEEADSSGTAMIGMHIRRGDLHPFEFQYNLDYLPLERYAEGARSLLSSTLAPKGTTEESLFVNAEAKSSFVLASDDPSILDSAELQHAISPFTSQRAQERILLATKATLDKSSPVVPQVSPDSVYVKHVEKNAGWEGGFYRALFFSLGNAVQTKPGSGTAEKLSSLPGVTSSKEDGDFRSISEQALHLREFVGRAYLLDLAVLGESDGVVCSVSSATCRALAVMMGRDAVRDGNWLNVDDGRSWSWNGRR